MNVILMFFGGQRCFSFLYFSVTVFLVPNAIENKTAPLLYYYLLSPPCRAVLLLAKALGVRLNLKVINILEGEQFTDEYLKLNPQHTIPTLVDDGIVLTESRAILGYLVDKYAKDDSLYPKDTTKRALVNQKLYFDMELFGRFLIYFKPILFSGDPPDSADLEKIKESLGFLDKFLVGLSWSAGEDITIADYALVATVSNVQEFCLDLSHYPYVDVWFAKAKAVIRGYEEINVAGLSALKEKYEMITE